MRSALTLSLAIGLAGCALTSKSDPLEVTYVKLTPRASAASEAAAQDAPELRLAPVRAAAFVEDRVAYEDEAGLLTYSARLRWAEPPQDTFGRALGRALYESGKARRTDGRELLVEVELVGFHVRGDQAVLAARLTVSRDDVALLERTIERTAASSREPSDEGAAELAAAMQGLLDQTAATVTSEVLAVTR